MSHNNSICKFRNYSRDSSLAAHDFSTKFRRHLFYRGQPSPAFRGAESVRQRLSRGGRQTAAQKRGWGLRCGERMPTAAQRRGCWQRRREVYGRRHREQFPTATQRGDESGGAGNGCRRQNRGGDAGRSTERCASNGTERCAGYGTESGYRRRHRGGDSGGGIKAESCSRPAAAGDRQQSGRFRFEFPAFFITLRHTY